MERFEDGGEQCFDMAKNNMTGIQGNVGITWIGYNENSPTLSLTDNSNTGMKGRACVVLNQTPIVHISKFSRMVALDRDFEIATLLLCRYFRLKFRVVGRGGLKTVYELFNAPKISP